MGKNKKNVFWRSLQFTNWTIARLLLLATSICLASCGNKGSDQNAKASPATPQAPAPSSNAKKSEATADNTASLTASEIARSTSVSQLRKLGVNLQLKNSPLLNLNRTTQEQCLDKLAKLAQLIEESQAKPMMDASSHPWRDLVSITFADRFILESSFVEKEGGEKKNIYSVQLPTMTSHQENIQGLQAYWEFIQTNRELESNNQTVLLFENDKALTLSDLKFLSEALGNIRVILRQNPDLKTVYLNSEFAYQPNHPMVRQPLNYPFRNVTEEMHNAFAQTVERRKKAVQSLNFFPLYNGRPSVDSKYERILQVFGSIPRLSDKLQDLNIQQVSIQPSTIEDQMAMDAVVQADDNAGYFLVISDAATEASILESLRQHQLLLEIKSLLGLYVEFEKISLTVNNSGNPLIVRSVFDRANVVQMLLKVAPDLRKAEFGFHYIRVGHENKTPVAQGLHVRRLFLNAKTTEAELRALLFKPDGTPIDIPKAAEPCRVFDSSTKEFRPCPNPF